MSTTPDISLPEEEFILRAKKEWEQTFDAVSDLIFIVDNNHTIIRANRAMAHYCGLTPMELVGRKCYEIMHGTNSAPDNCLHAKLLECGQSQTAEFCFVNLPGIFEVTASAMLNEDNGMLCSVHVARDITEKKRHEEQLATQQKQLIELNSSLEARIEQALAEQRTKDDILIKQSRLTAIGEMINHIIHHWRQPINNIGLIVQNLQLGFKVNDLTVEEMNEDVAEILKEVQQISDDLNDFRNFFRQEEEASSFVVNELVSRALSFLEPSLKSKGVRVELDEEPDVMADGYPNEYVQAVLNIMLSIKDGLGEHQNENPVIFIRISVENGHSVVTVSDNGGGIGEELLPKIFDLCVTNQPQNYGAGIGLYIAKMIIEKQMHGSLSARNVGEGVEFRMEV
jgi:PAS domain S-box-containing protein